MFIRSFLGAAALAAASGVASAQPVATPATSRPVSPYAATTVAIPVVKDHPYDNPDMHGRSPEVKAVSNTKPVNVFRRSAKARRYGRA